MIDMYQKTLSKTVSFEGIGLHSGKKSKIKLYPAQEDQGILFKRVDLTDNNLIEAKFSNVSSARLCTTLENEYGIKVSTVEHLLAAFYITGIDNVIVEIDNEEVPIMDGSSKDFIDGLKIAKLVKQTKKRKYLKIVDDIELIDGKRKISIKANESSLSVDFQLNYENRIIGQQKNVVDFQTNDLEEISSSRTFCLFEDIEKIKKFGLAKGGSLDNAVVVDGEKVLNDGGLRNDKEFVNHKILDLAGDFMLSGYRIIGKVSCYQGGHELTNLFLRKIFDTPDSFKLIKIDDFKVSKKHPQKELQKIAVNA